MICKLENKNCKLDHPVPHTYLPDLGLSVSLESNKLRCWLLGESCIVLWSENIMGMLRLNVVIIWANMILIVSYYYASIYGVCMGCRQQGHLSTSYLGGM